ncbi:hypothetical protein ABIE49_002036 [Bradyrhizobium sp. OAE829]
MQDVPSEIGYPGDGLGDEACNKDDCGEILVSSRCNTQRKRSREGFSKNSKRPVLRQKAYNIGFERRIVAVGLCWKGNDNWFEIYW